MNDQPNEQMIFRGVDPIQTAEFYITKRDGRRDLFNDARIALAIENAFRAEAAEQGKELSSDELLSVKQAAEAAVNIVLGKLVRGESVHVEQIQDIVEAQLMAQSHHSIARRYILYREHRKKVREQGKEAPAAQESAQPQEPAEAPLPTIAYVTKRDGSKEHFDVGQIHESIATASEGLEGVDPEVLAEDSIRNLYEGVTTKEIEKSNIMAARAHIERDPIHSFVAARLLLKIAYREALPKGSDLASVHNSYFKEYLKEGVKLARLSPEILNFDLEKISSALKLERDQKFNFMGIQTLYDRYLIHEKGRRLETPQYFWMRVSMGLAMQEAEQKEERAIEFYNVLSQFLFMSSTPTLFNAGTCHPQLSSCYLSTVKDDLDHIFKVIADDAKLSKWAGGLGNDWTNIRGTGSYIKGTNGESQGVIPFLKVANDTAVAVNQGGKRKGAMCAYLETWHLDIEDFLELRKNTGDERRRTHDMNTANWIPDLFMKRVAVKSHWTLFDPSETPDLHDLYGSAFEHRYQEYEAMAEKGELRQHKKIEAIVLWRKMLSMLFETGHPWITFKDPSNIRSPQDHTGVVHSSNLCTEILLNTSPDETAVCNLGSVNLPLHVDEKGGLNEKLVSQTVRTAMRMLDNVIDINFYPTIEAKNSNLKHRPVGLGVMGFQDALYKQRISYASQAAIEFADESMEMISFYAILSSTELAHERGTYQSYQGSKWDRGLLPIDTIDNIARERGGFFFVDRSSKMNWSIVRKAVKEHGMRNSNAMAIAPTATISNITGVTQSIEPTYKHLFSKSNLSGEFATINTYLYEDLRKLGLWDEEMIDDLKHFDGTLQEIKRIPAELKELYLTSFELDSKWLIECASRRQKWIDMGQSLNLYLAAPSGKKLHDMYFLAWEKGLKTTYYLRTLAATQIEKSTVDVNRRGIQPRWMKNKSASSNIEVQRTTTQTKTPKACSLDDPTCESCQ
jgi:ribonucleoside-diphosphate reductase alpha chain